MKESSLPKEESDRLERFITAFNQVESHLRDKLTQLQKGKKVQLDGIGRTELTRQYEEFNPGWRDGQQLRKFAQLRNVFAHEKDEVNQEWAIPTARAVSEIERIRDRLVKRTKTAFEIVKPQKTICVRPTDFLIDVLKKIKDHDYSQFPVYDNENFLGLITTNGITRWLAFHGVTETSLVEFEECTVADVLDKEEKNTNYAFIARVDQVEIVLKQFRDNYFLEALLVTEKGRKTDKLLGIITRWDIVQIDY